MTRGFRTILGLAILLSIGAAAAARPAPDESLAAANGMCRTRVEPWIPMRGAHGNYELNASRSLTGIVTTQDGYILSLQRIPSGRAGGSAAGGAGKIPVLLQHGLMMDGMTWLLNSPSESLGYILADNGYDVWIGNTRGTVYSLAHTSLSSNDPAYWNWSWDELASYDLSTMLQYVYDQSGQQKVHYVGHSLGTLIAFAALSSAGQQQPNRLSDQQQHVGMMRSAGLLSPIAFLNEVSSPLALGAADVFLAETLYWLGIDEFDPTGEAVHGLLIDVCKLPGVDCYDLLSSFTGDNCCLDNSSVQTFLAHEPQASSTKNMVHLAQMIRRGVIAKYDYGDAGDNMKYYGQATPPVYNVSAIPNDFPLFLGSGGRDSLSDVKDVQHLEQALKSHDDDKLTVQYLADYAHADFVMAGNANEKVYAPLVAFFRLQEK